MPNCTRYTHPHRTKGGRQIDVACTGAPSTPCCVHLPLPPTIRSKDLTPHIQFRPRDPRPSQRLIEQYSTVHCGARSVAAVRAAQRGSAPACSVSVRIDLVGARRGGGGGGGLPGGAGTVDVRHSDPVTLARTDLSPHGFCRLVLACVMVYRCSAILIPAVTCIYNSSIDRRHDA